MAIDPRIPLQGVPYQPPSFDLGKVYTDLARMQALDEQRRTSALNRGLAERAEARQSEWQQWIAKAMQPPPAPGGMGLTGAPPSVPPSMAGQTLPASPAQGRYGLTAPPPGQGMPPRFTRAPSSLQSLEQATRGLIAPPMAGPGAVPSGPPPQGLTAPPAPQGPRPGGPPSPFANLLKPLNMEALQHAYAIDPVKTAQWHTSQVHLQGQQLEHVEKRNDRIYTVVKRILTSDTPQHAYEQGIQQLRDEGIPLPKNLPPTYDAALMRHTAERHRSASMELAELKVAHQKQVLDLDVMKTGVEGLKAQTALQEARNAGQGVRKITGDKDTDATIAALYPQGVPPGQEGAAIARAQQAMDARTVDRETRLDAAKQPGRIAVSAATGYDAARLEKTEKPLDGSAGEAVATLTTLRTMTDDLAAMYKPEFTGPATGRSGYVREQTGYMAPEETAFRATVKDVQDILARLRSGAAIPAPEMRRLEGLAPDVNDRGPAFQAKLQRFQRALELTRESRLRVGTTGRGQLREEMQPTTPRVGQAGGKFLSEADIYATMQASGKPRQEVLAAAKAKGYTTR